MLYIKIGGKFTDHFRPQFVKACCLSIEITGQQYSKGRLETGIKVNCV